MNILIRFTTLMLSIFLLTSAAWAADDKFDFADCDITAIQSQFTYSSSGYKMGGLCNDVFPFTLSVSWYHGRREVIERFKSDQYGEGYLYARCLKDPVIFDDYCTGAHGDGLQTFHRRLVSRDRLTPEQKAALRQQFENVVPPPTINSPVAREFYGDQYRVGDDQYLIPLRVTMPEPGGRLSFRLLALVTDDSGQVSMQEVFTKKTNLFSRFIKAEEPYESSIQLPALHATNRSLFLRSLESIANFTVGDRAKMREALSVQALSRQIELPRQLASTTVNLDKALIVPVSGTGQISQAAVRPTYKQFTVISPRPSVRYKTAPMLKVFLPERDDVIFALIQCAGPDQRQPCDHNEGGISADDLHCARDNMECSAEVPFGFEMPFDKAYSLYIRPDSSGEDLVEVNFELGAMAEQLTPQAVARSPDISRSEISRARVATGVVVASIEQHTDPLVAGQPVDLKVWLKNLASVKSDAALKYSVVCEVRAGGSECPFKDAAYTVNTQIDPGARHAVKLHSSIAREGISPLNEPPLSANPTEMSVIQRVPGPKFRISCQSADLSLE